MFAYMVRVAASHRWKVEGGGGVVKYLKIL